MTKLITAHHPDASTGNDAPDVFDEQIAARAAERNRGQRAEATTSARTPLPKIQGSWRDNEVGVRREEDFQNKLTTIIFRDKPPIKAQELLLENGYRQQDDYSFDKPIDYLRRREHREEADNLLLEADNIIRAEKGLPKRESFYISRA